MKKLILMLAVVMLAGCGDYDFGSQKLTCTAVDGTITRLPEMVQWGYDDDGAQWVGSNIDGKGYSVYFPKAGDYCSVEVIRPMR